MSTREPKRVHDTINPTRQIKVKCVYPGMSFLQSEQSNHIKKWLWPSARTSLNIVTHHVSNGLRGEGVLLVPLAGVGGQFFVGKVLAHLVDHLMFLGQLGVSGVLASTGKRRIRRRRNRTRR